MNSLSYANVLIDKADSKSLLYQMLDNESITR